MRNLFWYPSVKGWQWFWLVLIVLVSSGHALGAASNQFLSAEDYGDTPFQTQLDQYLAARGWELGVSTANPDNAYIGFGYAAIALGTDDVRYGQARIAAFERAFIEAKGAFVTFRRGDYVTETIYDFLQDQLPQSPSGAAYMDRMENRLAQALEKAVDLAGIDLDRLLREVGIDGDEFQGANREQRTTLVYESIAPRQSVRAVESLAGLHVLATFEDLAGVGVLVIQSPSTEQVARHMARGENIAKNPIHRISGSVQDQLALLEDEDLIFVQGTRIMQDENGESMVVGFGQWSPSITAASSQRVIETSVQAARIHAQQRAEGTIGDFVNSTLVYESVSQFQEVQEIYTKTIGDRVQLVDFYDIGEYTEQLVRQYGSVVLEGITTVRRWSANHPDTGHLIIGHVVMWSPTTRDAARGYFPSVDDGQDDDEDSGDKDRGDVRVSPL